MPIISKKTDSKPEEIRIKIHSDLKEEILAYCKSFATGDLSHFFTEAAQYVLNRDKDWQDQKKSLSLNKTMDDPLIKPMK